MATRKTVKKYFYYYRQYLRIWTCLFEHPLIHLAEGGMLRDHLDLESFIRN